MNRFIGRQTVFSHELMPAACWLTYPAARHIFPDDESWRMRELLSDAMCYFDIAALTGRQTAFVTLTEAMLREEFAFFLPPPALVIGVPGSVKVDDTVEERLLHLRRAGFRIALTGYTELTARLRFDRIIEKFDYICVNVRQTELLALKDLMRRLRRSSAVLVAEGVDTEEEFDRVRALDFAMYRGDYLELPAPVQAELPGLADSACGDLVNVLLSPAIDPDACLEALQKEPILYYLMIRQTEELVSARKRIHKALRDRILELGPGDLLRWCSVVMLRTRNAHATEELPWQAYLRGVFVQHLAENSGTGIPSFQAFLLGMFSLLDAVTSIRLEQLFAGLHLAPGMKAALLGREENGS